MNCIAFIAAMGRERDEAAMGREQDEDTWLVCLPPHSDLKEVLLGVIRGPVVHLHHSIGECDLHPCQH